MSGATTHMTHNLDFDKKEGDVERNDACNIQYATVCE
jgi:hypothetical protein